MRAFSSCRERVLLFVAVRGLLIAMASRCRAQAVGTRASAVVAHGLSSCGTRSVVVARGIQSTGSVAVAHGLSCSAACGIFPEQGWNHVPCIGRWILNHCATREALRKNISLNAVVDLVHLEFKTTFLLVVQVSIQSAIHFLA